MFNPETVKAGDKNTSVLLLQEILRARGFKGKNGKALKLTWTADANTIYALKAYQESRKEVLEVDGICGSATWKDLIAIYIKLVDCLEKCLIYRHIRRFAD